jgi:hypothetical protein
MSQGTMSKRTDRLTARAAELRNLEHIAYIRLRNAERGLTEHGIKDLSSITNAFRAEVNAARDALGAIHHEQQNIIQDLDSHTTDLPDTAMIMVETPCGYQIFERRDPDNIGRDDTNWYHLNDPHDADPMTFDSVAGDIMNDPDGNDRYHTYTFYRLYTQDQVDDLLDKALDL